MHGTWEILFFTVFNDQFSNLVDAVKKLKEKNPKAYKNHATTKLLAKVYRSIFHDAAVDPAHKKFSLGNTLGQRRRHWKRIKNGLPVRHRIFFQFSTAENDIIIAWLNDEDTLRKDGDKNDVYNYFKRLLDRRTIPDDNKSLRRDSVKIDPTEQKNI